MLIATTVGVLAIHNAVLHRLAPHWSHVGLNAAVGVALVGLARRGGVTWSAMGFAAGTEPLGRRVGTRAAALVVMVVAAAAAIPAGRGLLDDGRFDLVSAAAASRKLLVEIPATVTFEEVVFRGVLLAVLLRSMSQVGAVGVSSVLFGLWHVLGATSGIAGDGSGLVTTDPVVVTAGTVLGTTAAGVALGWIQLRDRTLLSPVLVHGTLNGATYAVGWAVARSN